MGIIKNQAFFILLLIIVSGCIKRNDTKLTKDILLEELKNNHRVKDWYVPLGLAIEGLSDEQVSQKDSLDDHSIKQLVSHLAFWNERILIDFKGDPVPYFDDNNESTFLMFEDVNWNLVVAKMDSIQRDWIRTLEVSGADRLEKRGSEIASMSSHNAYHTGQIVQIRKRNGWWDEENGVK